MNLSLSPVAAGWLHKLETSKVFFTADQINRHLIWLEINAMCVTLWFMGFNKVCNHLPESYRYVFVSFHHYLHSKNDLIHMIRFVLFNQYRMYLCCLFRYRNFMKFRKKNVLWLPLFWIRIKSYRLISYE